MTTHTILALLHEHPRASIRMLAGMLGISTKHARNLRAAAGIRPGRGRNQPTLGTRTEKTLAIEAYVAAHPDATWREVAEKFGVSKQWVGYVANRPYRGD